MLFDIHSDDDDFLDNSPKKSLPSFFGDGIASSSRPPFLPYNGGSGFDAPPEDEPHGRGPTKSLTGTPGFDFDEDDEEQIRERAAAAARPRGGKFKETSARAWDSFLQTLGVRRKIEVGGERTIYINDQAMNNQFKYCNNYVSTGKYNLVTFVPKFLAGVSLLFPPYRSDAGTQYVLTLKLFATSRTILEIRQRLLLVHRGNHADSRRVTHQPIHYHSTIIHRPPCGSVQGNTRRLQTASE